MATRGQELPSWVLQLKQIKQQVRANLEHMPDFTCLETIDRFRGYGSARLTRIDRLRFEVAFVGGKELFAAPGGRGSEMKDLVAYGRGGFIGSGDYSAFLHGLFATENARFTWIGREPLRAADPLSGTILSTRRSSATIEFG